MKGRLIWIPLLAILVLVMACGVAVEVPTAHVGKINTDAGLQEDVLPPSKFKLETWCRSCDSLILVDDPILDCARSLHRLTVERHRCQGWYQG